MVVAAGRLPACPSLAQALAQLRAAPAPAAIVGTEEGGLAARAVRSLAEALLRLGADRLVWARVRRDLAVLARSP